MTAQAEGEIPGKTDPGQGHFVICSSGGRRWSLPADLVSDVAPVVPAAPVPFARPAFEGIVEAGGFPTAQIDLSGYTGGPAGTGRYAMLVETSRGPIKVRVDSASLAASASGVADEALPGLAAIESLVADLVPAERCGVPRQAARTDADYERLDFLVIRSGPAPVAVPAIDVEMVERHDGAWKPRMADAGERAIALDGEVLSGWSLAAWLGHSSGHGSDQGENEDWVIVLGRGNQRLSLTVAEVRGLVSVPRRRIRHLAHQTGASSMWLLGCGGDPIEVIGPAGFEGTGVREATQHLAPPAEPALSIPNLPDDQGQLAVQAGPFNCVFPAAAVAEIRGGIDRKDLRACRSRAALPVFDPAVLLGLPDAGLDATRAVVLRRPSSRRAVSLLAANVGTAGAGKWHPLPAVPPLVHDLFRSVRLNGTSCDFLLRETAFARSGCRAVAGLLEDALAGWLSGAR